MTSFTDQQELIRFKDLPFYYRDGRIKLRNVSQNWDCAARCLRWPNEIIVAEREDTVLDLEAEDNAITTRTFRVRTICSCPFGCNNCSRQVIYEEF